MAERKEKRYVSDNAQLMAEWDWEKNIGLDPAQLTLGSNKKVWWKCSQGHEWQISIAHRYRGHNCPSCANQRVLRGYNDLQTINPNLANEWNFEKNNGLTPADVLPGSSKKVWWKCNKGHEWKATISSRNKGKGCPYCSGRFATKGVNDLQTINPSLAKEWHFEKNNGLTPADVLPNSSKIVWWRCVKGHDYQSTVSGRNNGHGCPYCSNHKVLKGYNDLQTLNPVLAKEWNYKKNKALTPADVLPGSSKKVWWTCGIGHEWQAMVLSRSRGSGCPICSGQQVLKGYNDLQTTNQSLAREWNCEKNKGLTPTNITSNSGKKVWWKCNQGHEWQAKISHRYNGSGCPYCSGRFAIKGENDLQTINPDLANEWDYDNNAELTPMDVLPNSNKKVWWKCNQGHRWQATIASRYQGNGCPYCSKLSHSKILNVETGEVFESYSDASKKYEISVTPISNCCKGKQKTAGGYHWRFVVEE